MAPAIHLGTNITVRTYLTATETLNYSGTNFIFLNRLEAVVYYTTNENASTNIFFSNSFNSNYINGHLRSVTTNMVMTRQETFTNVVVSESNYITTTHHTNYSTTTNQVTEAAYTNSVVSGTQFITNLNWNNWDFSEANLSYLNLRGYLFGGANFFPSRFTGG